MHLKTRGNEINDDSHSCDMHRFSTAINTSLPVLLMKLNVFLRSYYFLIHT